MNRWTIGLTGMLLVLSTACSGASDGAAKGTTSAGGSPDTIDIVLVDDGIGSLGPRAGEVNSCPGCSRWPTQFADRVTPATGRETTLESYRAGGVPEARELVSGDTATRAATADAEVVIVATGAYNSLPDPETGIGCPTAPTQEPTYAAWARTTNPTCLAEMIKTYGLLYDGVFSEIKKLREGEPTVYLAFTVADYNIAVGGTDTLLGQVKGADRVWAKKFAIAANDRWNAMPAERAAAAGFDVVDVYHAVNGVDGATPAQALFVPDSPLPNEAGHDLITGLLDSVDLNAIKP